MSPHSGKRISLDLSALTSLPRSKLDQKQLGSKSEQKTKPRVEAPVQALQINQEGNQKRVSELRTSNNRFKFLRKSMSFDNNMLEKANVNQGQDNAKRIQEKKYEEENFRDRFSHVRADVSVADRMKNAKEKGKAAIEVQPLGVQNADHKFRYLRRSLSVDNVLTVGGYLSTKKEERPNMESDDRSRILGALYSLRPRSFTTWDPTARHSDSWLNYNELQLTSISSLSPKPAKPSLIVHGSSWGDYRTLHKYDTTAQLDIPTPEAFHQTTFQNLDDRPPVRMQVYHLPSEERFFSSQDEFVPPFVSMEVSIPKKEEIKLVTNSRRTRDLLWPNVPAVSPTL